MFRYYGSVGWILWKERNNKTFDRRVQMIQDVLVKVADKVVTWFQTRFKTLELTTGVLGWSS